MRQKKQLSRRRFIQMASTFAAGAISAACGVKPNEAKPAVRAADATRSPVSGSDMPMQAQPAPSSGGAMTMGGATAGRAASPDFQADVEIDLLATPGEQEIFAGPKTRVWHYQGEVIRGDKNALASIPGSYLGPVLRFKNGQNVRINFTNNLPEDSIIHWHGLHVPSVMDGLPTQEVGPGGTYVYEFTVDNRAATHWFHPHPDMRTGYQAYQGLAGLVLVSDNEEQNLGLPSGEFDLPLVIQDRLVDSQNQWIYPSPNNLMAFMQGVLGNNILVNGKPNFTLPVAATAYRLRLLNGSNARTYRLAWEDGSPWTVIGTDGGLLEAPVKRPYLMLSPGERLEVWADFSNRRVGSQLKLVSQGFAGGTMQMMNGMGMGNTLPNGASFTVLTVSVDRAGPESASLPARLSTIERLVEKDAVNAASPRTITLSMSHMIWLMNGRTYVKNEVAPDEIVKLNTTEAWVFYNGGMGMMGGMANAGMGMGSRMGAGMNSTPIAGANLAPGTGMGGMMNMPHIMHLHGLQFQIIQRQVDAANQADWQTIKDGLVEEGWKDTFLIMPGEQVKFLARFVDFTGLYMYHCHIIEHEDMGMMRFYRVDA